jgi:hypothetical protein
MKNQIVILQDGKPKDLAWAAKDKDFERCAVKDLRGRSKTKTVKDGPQRRKMLKTNVLFY